MPTIISDIFANAKLDFNGPVRWSVPINNGNPGVYIVSTSDDPDANLGVMPNPAISIDKIDEWLRRVPAFELNGVRDPEAAGVAKHLAEFWLPDENILYIGMTTRKVQTRVREYYNTPLGNRRPHAGGHWIKTLTNLTRFNIYHAGCKFPKSKKDELLRYFISNVSEETKLHLKDPKHPFPFANLAYPHGTIKKHSISKSKLK